MEQETESLRQPLLMLGITTIPLHLPFLKRFRTEWQVDGTP